MKVAEDSSLFRENADEKSPDEAAVFVSPRRINNNGRQLLSDALFALVTRIVSAGDAGISTRAAYE